MFFITQSDHTLQFHVLITLLLSYQRNICTSESSPMCLSILQTTVKTSLVALTHVSFVLQLQRSNQRPAEQQIYWSKQRERANNTAAEQRTTGRFDTDRREREGADYLRKQAASEEVGRPATLTGDSYTDLRRDGGKMSNNKKKGLYGKCCRVRWGGAMLKWATSNKREDRIKVKWQWGTRVQKIEMTEIFTKDGEDKGGRRCIIKTKN